MLKRGKHSSPDIASEIVKGLLLFLGKVFSLFEEKVVDVEKGFFPPPHRSVARMRKPPIKMLTNVFGKIKCLIQIK